MIWQELKVYPSKDACNEIIKRILSNEPLHKLEESPLNIVRPLETVTVLE